DCRSVACDVGRAIVFTRTKRGANKVMQYLDKAGFRAEAIHGNKSQNARQQTLENFRKGRSSVLVATDIASRGIDIDDVTHVFNYELPHEPESYVHRIGRTARKGTEGIAISLCDPGERAQLRSIEKLLKQSIPVVGDAPDLETPVNETSEKRGKRRRPGGGQNNSSR
ncbi:MAG: C-terminal helicase domain-containing protein, partial [Xanthomonadales bacterium]|nr:C-terminal helicase domain-containing protein [Xanthomonadales bacterium]